MPSPTTTPNGAASADSHTSEPGPVSSSFHVDDMPDNGSEESTTQDDQPTGPGLTESEVLAKLQTNYGIVEQWRGIVGSYGSHTLEAIAAHIYRNPQIHGLLEEPPTAPPPPPPGDSESGQGFARPRPQPTVDRWFEIAQWWADRHSGGRYIYDSNPKSRAWWWFDNVCWHLLGNNDPRLMDEIARNRHGYVQQLADEQCREAADRLSDDHEWRWARSSTTHDFAAGLRHHLGGAMPQPEQYHKATPSGVVDLRTGELLPHSPELWTRAVTLGDYRPDDAEAHMAALTKRFGGGKVFASETLNSYLRLIGLALTGLAQSYRAIVLIVGESGSGKGDAGNVAQRALGGLGLGVAREWLAQKSRSDIDATSTDLLEHQPAIIRVDELGSDTDITPSRLMSFTGNAPTSSRRPHGPTISGTVRGQLWATAVQPPTIPRDSGIERRLAVLPTIRKLAESEKDEAGGQDPALMNALVTMAMQYAAEVYLEGYEAPQGDTGAKGLVLSDMDEAAAWLEEQDDLHGMGVTEAWNRALAQLGMTDKELTQTRFGRKVAKSTRWDKAQVAGGTRVIIGRGQTPPAAARRASLLLVS